MCNRSKKEDERILHFSLSTAGPQPSEKELVTETKAARLLDIAQPYLQKITEAALAAAAGETAKDLYKY